MLAMLLRLIFIRDIHCSVIQTKLLLRKKDMRFYRILTIQQKISMNAKHSHCINSIAILFVAVLLTGVQQTAGAQAFDKAKNLNLWNDGRNVTGIRTDSVTISCYPKDYAEPGQLASAVIKKRAL